MKHKELTGQIIECAYKVHNHLGFGFLESVYQNALLIELEKAGLKAKMEVPINVFYDCTKKNIRVIREIRAKKMEIKNE